MKSWQKIIESVMQQKTIRGWDRVYWAIDLHDSIITGKYNKFNQGATIYPYAKETLDFLFLSECHRTILWTSSYSEAVDDVLKRFDLKFHYFNENPECPNTELCDFSKKFYFNILIDDKSGFEGTDWEKIYLALTLKSDV